MYLEKLRLDDRVAVVTGGGRGIGLCIAEALAEAGAHVVLADRAMDVLEEGRMALARNGYAVDAVRLNVTRSTDVDRVADELADRFGHVDILVANAGIGQPPTPAENITDDDWLAVHDVNLNGVFWCTRAFGRHMLSQGRGSIVTLGSMSGSIVTRPQGQSHYSSSKAAVHHLTKSLAAEWAHRGVRVNSVAPTYIDTPLIRHAHESGLARQWIDDTPMQRIGLPEEVASVVHFLSSDAASLMTGAVVAVDAGFTCW